MQVAFEKGNIGTTADVDWEYGGYAYVPMLEPRKGRQDAAGFFSALSVLNITKLQPKRLLSGTGEKIEEEDEIHLWTFNKQGQVARFRHRADTYRLVTALNKGL